MFSETKIRFYLLLMISFSDSPSIRQFRLWIHCGGLYMCWLGHHPFLYRFHPNALILMHTGWFCHEMHHKLTKTRLFVAKPFSEVLSSTLTLYLELHLFSFKCCVTSCVQLWFNLPLRINDSLQRRLLSSRGVPNPKPPWSGGLPKTRVPPPLSSINELLHSSLSLPFFFSSFLSLFYFSLSPFITPSHLRTPLEGVDTPPEKMWSELRHKKNFGTPLFALLARFRP